MKHDTYQEERERVVFHNTRAARPAARSALAAPQCPEPALPPRERLQRLPESPLVEIRPQTVGEIKLRVGAFPQEKIAQSLLRPRADQKIHVARRIGAMIDFV